MKKLKIKSKDIKVTMTAQGFDIVIKLPKSFLLEDDDKPQKKKKKKRAKAKG